MYWHGYKDFIQKSHSLGHSHSVKTVSFFKINFIGIVSLDGYIYVMYIYLLQCATHVNLYSNLFTEFFVKWYGIEYSYCLKNKN